MSFPHCTPTFPSNWLSVRKVFVHLTAFSADFIALTLLEWACSQSFALIGTFSLA